MSLDSHTPAQEQALQLLQKAGIEVIVGDYDLDILRKAPNAILLTNKTAGLPDGLVLLYLLSLKSDNFALFNPSPSPPHKKLRPYTLKPWLIAPGRKSPLKDMAARLQSKVAEGTNIGLAADFGDGSLLRIGDQWLRMAVLRQLRNARTYILPIHLQAPEYADENFWKKNTRRLIGQKNKRIVRITVRIGEPIAPEEAAAFAQNRLWARYVQARIFSLGSPLEDNLTKPQTPSAAPEPLAPPIPPDEIARELEALPPEKRMCSRSQFDVFVASINDAPNAMFEIARLREWSFREVGEGTGKSRDIDEYDLYYLQLIIWDRQARRIVGGYRLGQGDKIFAKFGIQGFYLHSLFRVKEPFFPILKQCVELGRSYVAPDYQRQRLPLFLLWKGILHFLMANPQYRYLCGPVSISKYYTDVSKSVIIEFVKQHFFDKKLAAYVRPRKPFRPRSRKVNAALLAQRMEGKFEALERFVELIEPRHASVPVLLRQYLRQNARFVAFNVDPAFSDCLDGLMVLDLRELPAETIESLRQER